MNIGKFTGSYEIPNSIASIKPIECCKREHIHQIEEYSSLIIIIVATGDEVTPFRRIILISMSCKAIELHLERKNKNILLALLSLFT